MGGTGTMGDVSVFGISSADWLSVSDLNLGLGAE